MISGRCKGCRHWHTAVEFDQLTPGERLPEGWGHCELTVLHEGDRPVPIRLARSDGTEGWNATLLTAPEFGCVQFEPKEG